METEMTEEERQRYIEAYERWNEKHNGNGETEIIIGQTPNGGDYSVAYYYDKNNKPCKKKDAYMVKIVEYTNKDEYVNSTVAFIKE